MKPRLSMLERAQAAVRALQSGGGAKSFTAGSEPYVMAIAVAVLQEIPEDALRALELFRGDRCENYTDGLGACYRAGRTPDAEFLADRCCVPCVAAATLEKGRINA